MSSTEKYVKNLARFTNAHAPSGAESEVAQIYADDLSEWGEVTTDRIGSVAYSKGEGKHVLITAHMDEVGFRVQSITSNGFIKFVEVGGWWGHTLLAQRVVIKTRAGRKIMGVIGSKPIHFLPPAERTQVLGTSAMYIDIGATSRNEVHQLGVALGDFIAPATEFAAMDTPDMYIAKAFDNRVGCAALTDIAADLPEGVQGLKITLGATAQEEVGTRGARPLANVLNPDYAIVLEGTPADDTPGFSLDTSQGVVRRGVQIRLHDPTAIMSQELVELAVECARSENIPYQLAVRTSGGTDAGAFSYTQSGIPSVVIGVPSRYIHTHNSVINIKDYIAMKELAVAMVKNFPV